MGGDNSITQININIQKVNLLRRLTKGEFNGVMKRIHKLHKLSKSLLALCPTKKKCRQ